jgi:hypothetical protein
MAQKLLLVSSVAPHDLLISYLTDAYPLLSEHRAWIASRHRDDVAFVDAVSQSFSVVLDASAKAAKERSEAVQATEAQSDALQEARTLSSWVREQGAYIAGELARSSNSSDRIEAGRVRVACGVGTRMNTTRQTGLRKLLLVQNEGLATIQSVWTAWKRPADSGQRVAASLARIEAAIQAQAKEKVEADMAQDRFEALADEAIDAANRLLRLVNTATDEVPVNLLTALTGLQKQHTKIFWVSGAGQPVGPEEPEEPADPVAPADPTT